MLMNFERILLSYFIKFYKILKTKCEWKCIKLVYIDGEIIVKIFAFYL